MTPRRRVAIAALLAALVGLVALGPRVPVDERWHEVDVGSDVEAHLVANESAVEGLPASEAKAVVWSGAAGVGTPFALVYLHGFSADRHEVDPLLGLVAERLGANVFYQRLAGHALPGAALAEVEVSDWLDDAAEALAVGEAIGERVVLVGTSTGGTLALWAAARPEAATRVAALVLLSPNLGLRDPAASLLLAPWGGLLARLVVGPERCFVPENEAQDRHWTTCYPTGALLPMMGLVDLVRDGSVEQMRAPTLILFSTDDAVVDPAATYRAFARLPGAPKRLVTVDDSNDPADHVIAGDIMSPGTTARIADEIVDFLVTLPVAGAPPSGGVP